MKLCGIQLDGYASLAPMAGGADNSMRALCRGYGASMTTSELVSAKGIVLGDRKSDKLLSFGQDETPVALQIFGCEPEIMAEAAKHAERKGPQFIDINMGCPAPKVAGNGGGSSLMRDPDLAARITEAVVKTVSLPVTVKIRSGWDADSVNAPVVAKKCEDAGAAAVTVHARTRAQMYAPPADLSVIKAVKQAVKIPVIGNGDIFTPDDAAKMYEETGCDHVMIGRGALGRPWIFMQVNAWLSNGQHIPEPPLAERMRVMIRQAQMMASALGERSAMVQMRKHAGWYLRGFRGAANLRRECGSLESFDDVLRLAAAVIEMQNSQFGEGVE